MDQGLGHEFYTHHRWTLEIGLRGSDMLALCPFNQNSPPISLHVTSLPLFFFSRIQVLGGGEGASESNNKTPILLEWDRFSMPSYFFSFPWKKAWSHQSDFSGNRVWAYCSPVMYFHFQAVLMEEKRGVVRSDFLAPPSYLVLQHYRSGLLFVEVAEGRDLISLTIGVFYCSSHHVGLFAARPIQRCVPGCLADLLLFCAE